jgi:hypothetical protein
MSGEENRFLVGQEHMPDCPATTPPFAGSCTCPKDGGNQPPSGVRGDPGVDRTSNDDTRDNGSSLSSTTYLGDASPGLVERLIKAARNADWIQVVLNQGPPCFHFEADRVRFCLRAQRWAGHSDDAGDIGHRFISLADLLEAALALSGAELAQLKSDLARTTEAWAIAADDRDEANGLLRAAEAELARLAPYVQHKSDCASQGGYDHVGQDEDGNAVHLGHEPYPCTCGLQQEHDAPTQQETP